MRRASLLFGLLAFAGCSGGMREDTGYDIDSAPMSFPVSKTVKDERLAFTFDANSPWQLSFGRGSGMDGLDTVELNSGGRADFHRGVMRHDWLDVRSRSWQTASCALPPVAVASIAAAITGNRVPDLERAYHADIFDGTQWILWLRQGGRDKAVYFDNHFPDAVVRFAAELDAILAKSAGPQLRWREVLAWDNRQHEKSLWESIK